MFFLDWHMLGIATLRSQRHGDVTIAEYLKAPAHQGHRDIATMEVLPLSQDFVKGFGLF